MPGMPYSGSIVQDATRKEDQARLARCKETLESFPKAGSFQRDYSEEIMEIKEFLSDKWSMIRSACAKLLRTSVELPEPALASLIDDLCRLCKSESQWQTIHGSLLGIDALIPRADVRVLDKLSMLCLDLIGHVRNPIRDASRTCLVSIQKKMVAKSVLIDLIVSRAKDILSISSSDEDGDRVDKESLVLTLDGMLGCLVDNYQQFPQLLLQLQATRCAANQGNDHDSRRYSLAQQLESSIKVVNTMKMCMLHSASSVRQKAGQVLTIILLNFLRDKERKKDIDKENDTMERSRVKGSAVGEMPDTVAAISTTTTFTTADRSTGADPSAALEEEESPRLNFVDHIISYVLMEAIESNSSDLEHTVWRAQEISLMVAEELIKEVITIEEARFEAIIDRGFLEHENSIKDGTRKPHPRLSPFIATGVESNRQPQQMPPPPELRRAEASYTGRRSIKAVRSFLSVVKNCLPSLLCHEKFEVRRMILQLLPYLARALVLMDTEERQHVQIPIDPNHQRDHVHPAPCSDAGSATASGTGTVGDDGHEQGQLAPQDYELMLQQGIEPYSNFRSRSRAGSITSAISTSRYGGDGGGAESSALRIDVALSKSGDGYLAGMAEALADAPERGIVPTASSLNSTMEGASYIETAVDAAAITDALSTATLHDSDAHSVQETFDSVSESVSAVSSAFNTPKPPRHARPTTDVTAAGTGNGFRGLSGQYCDGDAAGASRVAGAATDDMGSRHASRTVSLDLGLLANMVWLNEVIKENQHMFEVFVVRDSWETHNSVRLIHMRSFSRDDHMALASMAVGGDNFRSVALGTLSTISNTFGADSTAVSRSASAAASPDGKDSPPGRFRNGSLGPAVESEGGSVTADAAATDDDDAVDAFYQARTVLLESSDDEDNPSCDDNDDCDPASVPPFNGKVVVNGGLLSESNSIDLQTTSTLENVVIRLQEDPRGLKPSSINSSSSGGAFPRGVVDNWSLDGRGRLLELENRLLFHKFVKGIHASDSPAAIDELIETLTANCETILDMISDTLDQWEILFTHNASTHQGFPEIILSTDFVEGFSLIKAFLLGVKCRFIQAPELKSSSPRVQSMLMKANKLLHKHGRMVYEWIRRIAQVQVLSGTSTQPSQRSTVVGVTLGRLTSSQLLSQLLEVGCFLTGTGTRAGSNASSRNSHSAVVATTAAGLTGGLGVEGAWRGAGSETGVLPIPALQLMSRLCTTAMLYAGAKDAVTKSAHASGSFSTSSSSAGAGTGVGTSSSTVRSVANTPGRGSPSHAYVQQQHVQQHVRRAWGYDAESGTSGAGRDEIALTVIPSLTDAATNPTVYDADVGEAMQTAGTSGKVRGAAAPPPSLHDTLNISLGSNMKAHSNPVGHTALATTFPSNANAQSIASSPSLPKSPAALFGASLGSDFSFPPLGTSAAASPTKSIISSTADIIGGGGGGGGGGGAGAGSKPSGKSQLMNRWNCEAVSPVLFCLANALTDERESLCLAAVTIEWIISSMLNPIWLDNRYGARKNMFDALVVLLSVSAEKRSPVAGGSSSAAGLFFLSMRVVRAVAEALSLRNAPTSAGGATAGGIVNSGAGSGSANGGSGGAGKPLLDLKSVLCLMRAGLLGLTAAVRYYLPLKHKVYRASSSSSSRAQPSPDMKKRNMAGSFQTHANNNGFAGDNADDDQKQGQPQVPGWWNDIHIAEIQPIVSVCTSAFAEAVEYYKQQFPYTPPPDRLSELPPPPHQQEQADHLIPLASMGSISEKVQTQKSVNFAPALTVEAKCGSNGTGSGAGSSCGCGLMSTSSKSPPKGAGAGAGTSLTPGKPEGSPILKTVASRAMDAGGAGSTVSKSVSTCASNETVFAINASADFAAVDEDEFSDWDEEEDEEENEIMITDSAANLHTALLVGHLWADMEQLSMQLSIWAEYISK